MTSVLDLNKSSTPIKLSVGTNNNSNYIFSRDTQSFLDAARQINSDTKCYIRRSHFTSALTKRFYKNNSLLAHGKSLSKERNLHEKKRFLLEGIGAENEVIKVLEMKLLDEIARLRNELDRHQRHVLACLAATQGHFRRRRACEVVQKRRAEYNAKFRIAFFAETRMRGWRDRKFASAYRQRVELERKEREIASVRIQTYQRRKVAMHILSQLKFQRLLLKLCASTRIQSFARTARCKKIRREKLFLIRQELQRTCAAVCIQCFARKHLSTAIMRKKIEERRRKEDEARNELLSRHQIVPPVVLVSPPRRPFVVGKPQPESIARIIRDIREHSNLIEEARIPVTGISFQDKDAVTPAKSISQSVLTSPHLPSFDGARGSDSFANQMRTDVCLIISDADIVESARRKASARAARVARRRRENKESEQAAAREAAKRAIALELKRKQYFRANTRRRICTSPKSAVAEDNTTKSEQELSDNLSCSNSAFFEDSKEKLSATMQQSHQRSSFISSAIRPREFQPDALEVQLETIHESVQHPAKQSLSSSTATNPDQLFPPLLDVSFEDFFEETENDLESHSEAI